MTSRAADKLKRDTRNRCATDRAARRNDLVTAAGGSISAEHGIGQLKRDELARLVTQENGKIDGEGTPFDPYGGNLDDAHRAQIADRLTERGRGGDQASRDHLVRRTPFG